MKSVPNDFAVTVMVEIVARRGATKYTMSRRTSLHAVVGKPAITNALKKCETNTRRNVGAMCSKNVKDIYGVVLDGMLVGRVNGPTLNLPRHVLDNKTVPDGGRTKGMIHI